MGAVSLATRKSEPRIVLLLVLSFHSALYCRDLSSQYPRAPGWILRDPVTDWRCDWLLDQVS